MRVNALMQKPSWIFPPERIIKVMVLIEQNSEISKCLSYQIYTRNFYTPVENTVSSIFRSCFEDPTKQLFTFSTFIQQRNLKFLVVPLLAVGVGLTNAHAIVFNTYDTQKKITPLSNSCRLGIHVHPCHNFRLSGASKVASLTVCSHNLSRKY